MTSPGGRRKGLGGAQVNELGVMDRTLYCEDVMGRGYTELHRNFTVLMSKMCHISGLSL